MICPSCGARVSDGALSCPRCHEPLDVTQKLSLSNATWCPGCGALVPSGESICPKCGTEVRPDSPAPSVRRTRSLDLPSIGDTGVIPVGEEEETNVMTRIESAIPGADGSSTPTALGDRMPRTRSFALAAALAVAVVGGATLYIPHPWDPDATSISAKTPADTSMQGFPGVVDSLSGQDDSGERVSAAEQVAQNMSAFYEELGELSARVDESEEDLRTTGVSGEKDARAAGLEGAQAIAIDISNLIDRMSGSFDDTSDWADDMGNLSTLGNWLRNRCDAIVEAWEVSAKSQDPAEDSAEIISEAARGRSFAALFSENYEDWRPSTD